MPATRCWNFNDNGTRKRWTTKNCSEMQCRADCRFVHPSDPGWDRAPPAPQRARGGPQGGRGRGSSSFGTSAPAASSSSLGPERDSSSGAWDDYMTASGPTASTTSSAWGATSHWGGQAKSRTDEWGDPGASGSGSSVNNNASTADGWSTEPTVWGGQASTSQLDTQATGWGPSNDGWNSAGIDPGPGWGGAPISDQGNKTPSTVAVANVASPAGPDMLGGAWTNNNSDLAMATTTPSSRTMPSVRTSSDPDAMHCEQRGDNSPPQTIVDHLPTERKTSSSSMFFWQSSLFNSITVQPPCGDYDKLVVPKSPDNEKIYMMLCIAITLKMHELDAKLSQLSVLRKSRQVATTRAAKDLLQDKVHELMDVRVAMEAEHNACFQELEPLDPFCLSIVQHNLATLDQDDKLLSQLGDWASRAERCFNHNQLEGSPISPIERLNEVTSLSQFNQLKERSESLAETDWQYQDLQFYDSLLNHWIKDKKDLIFAAIVKGQDASFTHLSMSLITLQKQQEVWNQTLQTQAKELAQALLQSNGLNKDKKSRSTLKAKENGIIQQLQADMTQRRSQIQALKEDMTQLQHLLTSIKQEHQHLHEYSSHIEEYIQKYVQQKAISNIKAVFSRTIAQFSATELTTVQKVWKTLQPITHMSTWLHHADLYNTEDVEIREIEDSLMA